ncbi:MAG: hypothetical protein H6618_08500 [Deltaproteobacteria bacterium]|nr:hypothetical protein [Deltaproteobacteria bacterium]
MISEKEELWSDMLRRIISERDLHVRWLATLSYLELVGTRKIISFLPAMNCPLSILQHAAEESRHASFFKAQIRKLGADPDQPCQLLGGGLAKWYLHRLDQWVVRVLKQSDLEEVKIPSVAYLLTTLCVELRAEWLYPVYETLLCSMKQPFSLKGVIREEEQHLRLIREELASFSFNPDYERLIYAEKGLFDDLTDQIALDLESGALSDRHHSSLPREASTAAFVI